MSALKENGMFFHWKIWKIIAKMKEEYHFTGKQKQCMAVTRNTTRILHTRMMRVGDDEEEMRLMLFLFTLFITSEQHTLTHVLSFKSLKMFDWQDFHFSFAVISTLYIRFAENSFKINVNRIWNEKSADDGRPRCESSSLCLPVPRSSNHFICVFNFRERKNNL